MNETEAYRPDHVQPTGGDGNEAAPRPTAERGDSEPPATDECAPPNDIPADLIDHPRYRILKKLGSGGMGTVYLAEHKLMRRPVALKVIRPELTARPRVVERYRREVLAAAQLAHPNIVTAHDAEQSGSCDFLVMEFVEGIDLAQLLKEHGPLPVGEACDYACQAALGLQHAHERQMIHRDIKPSNMLRTPQGQIKIADFGLAQMAHGSVEYQAAVTESGVVLGTPDYMAPEQANDPRRVDGRADIYSLGCTLYQLLGGRVPFPGGGTMDKLMRHTRETPTPLDQLRPHLAPPLVQAVERMMAKNPAARFQTAAEVVAALTPWRHAVARSRPRQPSTRLVLACCAIAAVLLLGLGGIVYVALHNTWGGAPRDEEKQATKPPSAEKPKPLPDLTKLQPVFDDDFNEPAKSVLLVPGQQPKTKEAPGVLLNEGAEAFFHDHRQVIKLLPRPSGTRLAHVFQHREQCADFACLLRCRFSGQGDVGWAFLHHNGGKHAVAVHVRLDGAVEVTELDAQDPATLRNPSHGKFQPPTDEPVGEFSTLLVTLQGEKLTVFLNGRAVGAPIILERGFGPGTQGMAVWGRDKGEAVAEFTRFALWRLPETGPVEGK
jgi:Protein kinase domain